jgi:ribosomal-protein-alanine N-acetyltransferase
VTPFDIRRLTYADLPEVIAIERRAFPTPWSLAMFVLELSKPSGICLAATEPGAADRPSASDGDGEARLKGYLVCSRYDTTWHLMNVAVEPSERRHGIGAALLDALFARADRPGTEYTLEVRPSNLPAIGLYERAGFRSAGRRPGYYQDNREDALIMWRIVPESDGADGTVAPRDGVPKRGPVPVEADPRAPDR